MMVTDVVFTAVMQGTFNGVITNGAPTADVANTGQFMIRVKNSHISI
jgi:hypothetical protein